MRFWMPFILMGIGAGAGLALGQAGHVGAGIALFAGSLVAWLVALGAADRQERRRPAEPARPCAGVRGGLWPAVRIARASEGRWHWRASYQSAYLELSEGADEQEALEWLAQRHPAAIESVWSTDPTTPPRPLPGTTNAR